MISNSPETRLVSISVRAISMHRTESRDISNRKYLSKTILACRERQAKKKAGKLQTGSTIPKQYWLAVNGKPKITLSQTETGDFCSRVYTDIRSPGHLFTRRFTTQDIRPRIQLDFDFCSYGSANK